MTKQLLKYLAGGSIRSGGMLTLAERRNRGRLTILCYHRILPADRKAAYFIPDLVVTPESFREHCRILRQQYEVLPLHEAVEALRSGQATRRRLAAVTFDDGYQDNFRYALPVLTEVGIKATFFVIADLIGREQLPWYDRIARSIPALERKGMARESADASDNTAHLQKENGGSFNGNSSRRMVTHAKKLRPADRRKLVEQLSAEARIVEDVSRDDLIMDWRQLTELADLGHEIGSHSGTHEILVQLDEGALESEVAGSRRMLEEGLHQPIRSFCYPNGDFDERITRAVRNAGYTCAVTTESGTNGPRTDAHRLHRWFIHEGRLSSPISKTSETLLRMELCGLSKKLFRRGRRKNRS